ncbi:MAG: F0F1 ATP synthase subunit B [Bacteroidales bacterium]|nr:F0F1 ATP synthase subunit B [Bacteroidales bacterium]
MGLVTPDYGTIFWMVLAFGLVFMLLKKFAWKPILNSLKNREQSIREALEAADVARGEMAKLQADNELVLQQARKERDALLDEAREMRESMIEEARDKAALEAEKVVLKARKQIENEKLSALSDIRKQISELSIQIAEKVLRKELSNAADHESLIQEMLKDIKLN